MIFKCFEMYLYMFVYIHTHWRLVSKWRMRWWLWSELTLEHNLLPRRWSSESKLLWLLIYPESNLDFGTESWGYPLIYPQTIPGMSHNLRFGEPPTPRFISTRIRFVLVNNTICCFFMQKLTHVELDYYYKFVIFVYIIIIFKSYLCYYVFMSSVTATTNWTWTRFFYLIIKSMWLLRFIFYLIIIARQKENTTKQHCIDIQ